MNLRDNYPAGVSEHSINKQFSNAFADWYKANEDYLLEEFIESYQHIVIIPAVKDWSPALTTMWNNYVDRQYQNWSDPTEEYEPE